MEGNCIVMKLRHTGAEVDRCGLERRSLEDSAYPGRAWVRGIGWEADVLTDIERMIVTPWQRELELWPFVARRSRRLD
jgi:hypothetical protein